MYKKLSCLYFIDRADNVQHEYKSPDEYQDKNLRPVARFPKIPLSIEPTANGMTRYPYSNSPTREVEPQSHLPKYSPPSSPPPAYSPRHSHDNAASGAVPLDNDPEALNAFEFGFEHRNPGHDEDGDHPVITSSSWPPRIRVQRSRTEMEASVAFFRNYFHLIHVFLATILVCVANPAIKLYQRPWDQIGDGNTAFGLSGSIVSLITATAAVILVPLAYKYLVLNCVEMIAYVAGAILLGYGTYVTRDNQICDGDRCSSIRLAAGWRCGIVVVVLCSLIILLYFVYVLIWTYYRLQIRRSSR